VDPLTSKYPWYTPYQFSGNKPIQFVELEGLEEGISAAGSITTSYTFGSKGKSHVNIGFGFSIMATGSTNIGDINAAGQASLNFSGNYSTGGLTAENANNGKKMLEFIFSPGATIGTLNKNTSTMDINYLHGNATTALENPMQYSFMYTLNFHNGTDNRKQRTATYGIRIGSFSLNVLEDHSAWIGADGDDKYWTGSGNANWQFGNGTMLTFGTDTYTGNSNNKGSTPLELGDFEIGGLTKTIGRKGLTYYWANQNKKDRSLNNAQTFLQVKTANGITSRLTSTGPFNFWSQNMIHDYLSPNFHHFKPSDSKNRWQIYFQNINPSK